MTFMSSLSQTIGDKPPSRAGFRSATAMSALLLKADVCAANRHVCFEPKADIRKETNRKAALRRSLDVISLLTSS
jgi:hypothetical protein